MERFDKLIATVQSYNPEADFDLIKKAFEFARQAHEGQTRLSGEPVINHPLAVAQILADFKLDSTSIAGGLLHDVVEDTDITLEKLEKEFGKEVAMLVNGVTKIGEIKLRGSKDEEFVENMRKMLLAMAKDLRVILIKLADRLHNMQTLEYLPLEKQIRIAKETLEIYAPLSERLGMGEMKGRLEDLAFPFAYKKDYQWLVEYSRPYIKDAEEFLVKATREVYKELAGEGIKAKIVSRPKHLYSLWRKLIRPEVNSDIVQIHDLVAMRILVETVKDCYAVLGIIHSLWKPVPTIGIRDFIAQPKPNGYRSIHTNVFSLQERILEIQIRTLEMHDQAENGIAAHWQYNLQKTSGVSDEKLEKGKVFAPDEKLSWVKQLISWQKEVVDTQDFIEALKFDAFAHRIFVFSPHGDVYDLPLGSTPVDFAYAVHTQLGDEADGAKVNGKMVSLDFGLKSGDIVDILKRKGSKPSEGWLRFVVTRQAKTQISRYFREKRQGGV